MMKTMIMVLTILPSVCLTVSAILYIKNRSSYQNLIHNFQKEYTFTNPYLLYSTMGFIGSPLIVYFFVSLLKNRNIFFLDRESKAYKFPHEDGNLQLITAIKPILSIFLMGFFCCLLLVFLTTSIMRGIILT